MILSLTRTSHADEKRERVRPRRRANFEAEKGRRFSNESRKIALRCTRRGRMKPISVAIEGAKARSSVLKMAAASVAIAMVLPCAASAQANRTPDISGMWQSVKYSPKLEIQGGGDIPYNEKGKELYAK